MRKADAGFWILDGVNEPSRMELVEWETSRKGMPCFAPNKARFIIHAPVRLCGVRCAF